METLIKGKIGKGNILMKGPRGPPSETEDGDGKFEVLFCHLNLPGDPCWEGVRPLYPACLTISVVFLCLSLIVYLAEGRYIQYQLWTSQTS